MSALAVDLAAARLAKTARQELLGASTLEAFAAIDEPGALPILGDASEALIAEDSDVMIYGDGGAGKTTLMVDFALHLGAGDDWLGISVPRPVRVLLIENEGPRPLLRGKIKRKLEGWGGSPLEGRVSIVETPWMQFTFAREHDRQALARKVEQREIDVMIAGPVTRLGMDEAGTLQHVRDFSNLLSAVRRASGRRLTICLIHHENRAGTVSGAWEGAVDTLLRVENRHAGGTRLLVEKARWSTAHHRRRLDLDWTDGDGFTVGAGLERDHHAEIQALLADGRWRTAKEIAAKEGTEAPGIGAGEKMVKEKLNERGDLYVARRGDKVGRSPRATVYQLRQIRSAVNAVDAVGDEGGTTASTPSIPEGDGVGCSPVHIPESAPHDPDDAVGTVLANSVAEGDPV